jgi:hypothetical protein
MADAKAAKKEGKLLVWSLVLHAWFQAARGMTVPAAWTIGICLIAELLACRLRLAGGKKGVDMAGMSDLGGVKFFNLAVETPNGDLALMDALLEGGSWTAVDGCKQPALASCTRGSYLFRAALTIQTWISCIAPRYLS